MMTLLCVHVPAFRLALARRNSGGIPAGEPAVLLDKRERGRVIEINSAAHALGARIGHTLLQARAAAAGAHVFIHDAALSRQTWSDMLDALDAVSPLVDDTAEGTAYLDMRGIGGDASEWTARVHKALAHFDLPVHAAAGPNKFMARALTYAPDGRVERLPIEVLELEPRAIERLHLLGIHTLEELAKLPHGPFVRRFGKQAAAWHDLARGIDPTPFRPRRHELQIDAAAYGEGSAQAEEQVLFALRVLADRVCSDLERAGRAASQICMAFECDDGEVREIDIGFAQPTGDPRTMLDLMRAKLEGVTFGSPVCGLRLQVLRLEERGAAAALFAQNEPDPQALAVTFARLQAVTGSAPQCARTRRAALMESRFAYSDVMLRQAQHDTVTVAQSSASSNVMLRQAQHDKGPVPQLRLLTVKEIDVSMKGNRPERVQRKRVLKCAGPWRVDDGWFDDPVMRDEYDVQLEDGMLCRIYRQGERWYLRGAYD
jgi:protein ImuB